MSNYRSEAFSREGLWGEALESELSDRYGFVIKRLPSKRREFIRKASEKIGGPVDVMGFIPLHMSYEIYYHKQRVEQVYSLSGDDISFFKIAPWKDGSTGRWRFKIVEVRKRDGETLKIENYSF